ncbi:hypothetical protein D3C83_216170 [compost metagenome]
MILERAETLGEGDMLALADVLIAQEQHLVDEQLAADLREQVVVAGRLGEADVEQLGADMRGQLLNTHLCLLNHEDR